MPPSDDELWNNSNKTKPKVVAGTDTEQPKKDPAPPKPPPINWKIVAIASAVGLVGYFSGWMSKTLYTDLSGLGPQSEAKLEILEAYSGYLGAMQAGTISNRYSKEILLNALQRNHGAYKYIAGEDARTVGVEPGGPRIVFSNGLEILLPGEVAGELIRSQ